MGQTGGDARSQQCAEVAHSAEDDVEMSCPVDLGLPGQPGEDQDDDEQPERFQPGAPGDGETGQHQTQRQGRELVGHDHCGCQQQDQAEQHSPSSRSRVVDHQLTR